jgi:COP9 signalosome complex subunit 7
MLTAVTATANLPKLSPQQEKKLRLLSLLPIARQQSNLTYSSLQSALSLDDPQALESLITTAIYSSLITGTIDPAHKVINITSVAPLRDLAPGSVPALVASLVHWSQQCSSTLSELQKEIAGIEGNAKTRGMQEDRVRELVDAKVAQAEESEKGRSKRGALDLRDDEDGDEMDVDNAPSIAARAGRMSKRLGIGRNG